MPTPFDSPLPTPSPTSLPSYAAQLAITHLAEKYHVLPSDLFVSNEHERDYPLQNASYRALSVFNSATRTSHKLLVDLNRHAVREDVDAVERAEAEAFRARYGRFDLPLHERLQQLEDSDLIEVAVWTAAKPRRTTYQLYEELALRFPEARTALEKFNNPFDVGDQERADAIRDVYLKLLEEDTRERLLPAIRRLCIQECRRF